MVHRSSLCFADDFQSSLSYTISLNIKVFYAMALVMNNIFRHTLLISQRFVIRSYCQGKLAAAAVTASAAAFAFYGKHIF